MYHLNYFLSVQGLSVLKVKVPQSSPNLCDPMDCTVHGILQGRILEWVAFPFSRGSSQPRDQTQVSHSAGRFFTRLATRVRSPCCPRDSQESYSAPQLKSINSSVLSLLYGPTLTSVLITFYYSHP